MQQVAMRAVGLTAAVLLLAGCDTTDSRDDARGMGRVNFEPGSFESPEEVGSLRHPDLKENSGLVASRRTPGVFWAHNDSGGRPVLYCVRARGGSCGAWRLEGAEAVDWEDIAAGPGPVPGEHYLYVGDIGNNVGNRREIVVYRLPEPIADRSERSRAERTTGPIDRLVLSFPREPEDAETLLVHPESGDLYIVTKRAGGRAAVFKAHSPLTEGQAKTLEHVGNVRIRLFAPGPTGGDISSDGRWVVLSSYLGAFEARARAGNFDRVWAARWTRFDPGSAHQREAIAYTLDGRAILSTSEGRRASIHRVVRAPSED